MENISTFFQDIITHPHYDSDSGQNDIALLRVAKPITFTSTVQPAQLQTDLRDKNRDIKLLVTGWNRGDCEFIVFAHLI